MRAGAQTVWARSAQRGVGRGLCSRPGNLFERKAGVGRDSGGPARPCSEARSDPERSCPLRLARTVDRAEGSCGASCRLIHSARNKGQNPKADSGPQRPHVCPYCSQSYIRPTHLTAHLRTHMSEEAKRYVCSVEGCGKRFWTGTHARRHEELHREPIPYGVSPPLFPSISISVRFD